MKCPFCHLLHDPEKTNCNDPHTGALIRRAAPIPDEQAQLYKLLKRGLAQPLTCDQLLEHARDSIDACLNELIAANKLANGLTSLLLLDLIENAGVMNARIRRILHEMQSLSTEGLSPQNAKEGL